MECYFSETLIYNFRKILKTFWKKIPIEEILRKLRLKFRKLIRLKFISGVVHTCDFSMVALCLSHIGLMSKLCSFSLSPCRKNSSINKSTHFRYRGSGLVGLLKSAQWTKFSSTCWQKMLLVWEWCKKSYLNIKNFKEKNLM